MVENDTVAKQIDLILRRLDGDGDKVEEYEMDDSQKGPPGIDDMVGILTPSTRHIAD
jgi:hypothetical protein